VVELMLEIQALHDGAKRLLPPPRRF